MQYNLAELKKLPEEEKIKLIEELWDSLEKKDSDEYDDVTDQLLQERYEEYKKGSINFEPWENVKKRIEEKLEAYRKSNAK
jgi:putative addiction module component (TIGR02574 family)